MPEALQALIPAAVVFGATALAVVVVVVAMRRARRGPRARALAEAERSKAGLALVALDDAVAELELEVGLSGALYGGDAPPSLRRARLTAVHARDESFEQFRDSDDGHPIEMRRAASRIIAGADEALAVIARARGEHAQWVRANVSASEQVASASARLAELRKTMGDPAALVHDLSSRFDEGEWDAASRAASAAVAGTEEAGRRLAAAAAHASDPSLSALPELAAAERALRDARNEARALEEAHRLVTQASAAVADELTTARAAVRQALALREGLEPDDAERLGAAIGEAQSAIARLEPYAARRPTQTIDALARLRDRLDLALGDARTAQQRLRGARSALPGTLSTARGAIARAEEAVAHAHTGADARVRLASAQRDLAAARQAGDPVEALDAARRAIRHAEDAQALADYDRRA